MRLILRFRGDPGIRLLIGDWQLKLFFMNELSLLILYVGTRRDQAIRVWRTGWLSDWRWALKQARRYHDGHS